MPTSIVDSEEIITRLSAHLSEPNRMMSYIFAPAGELSLSSGLPGLLLFFSTLQDDNIVKDIDQVVHNYVVAIKDHIEKKGLKNLSLFSGVSGICFALQIASKGGTRYVRMLNALQAYLLNNIHANYLHPLNENFMTKKPAASNLYDIMQGLCGIGRYALENLSDPRFKKLAEDIINALIVLCKPIEVHSNIVPGWFVSPQDPLHFLRPIAPSKGTLNLGIAHGVTGILAFLSIACLKGLEILGQKEAISTIVSWIQSKSFLYKDFPHWPYSVFLEEEVDKITPKRKISKDAWCYGVPGISISLLLAGKALKDPSLKTFAINAFHGIFSRTKEEWGLPGPNLCHGVAGLLLMTKEMAKEEGCEDLQKKVCDLQELLLSYYDPTYPLGFKDVDLDQRGNTVLVNKPGLLEGTAGIILTLLTDNNSEWHKPFLIHA